MTKDFEVWELMGPIVTVEIKSYLEYIKSKDISRELQFTWVGLQSR
jgi:hypothetical protein